MFTGVIFDFNGVLFWDNALHEAAWREYSQGLRGWALSEREMIDHVHGRVNADIFAYLLGERLPAGRLAVLAEEKETIYRRLCLAAGKMAGGFQLSPGAVPLLDFLVAAGIPHAIATSSAWPNVAFYVEHLALGRWFTREEIVYDEGRYPGKPAPDIYLETAERLGLRPAACVVVEDSVAGIAAARAAGIGHIVALGAVGRQGELAALPGIGEVISELGQFPRHRLRTPESSP